jgi:hypothetical protein
VRLQPDLHGVDRAHAVVEGVPDLFAAFAAAEELSWTKAWGPNTS